MTRWVKGRAAIVLAAAATAWTAVAGTARAHGAGNHSGDGDWVLPTTVGGLPLHPLVVHLVVVLVPLASLVVLVSALWPAARRGLGWITPVIGVAALVSVPVAVSSGEALIGEVEVSPMTAVHAELAEGLLPWVLGLAVWSLLLWLWERRAQRSAAGSPGRWGRAPAALVIVGAVLLSVGSTGHVVQIGESGARSVWTEVVS